jgi:nitrogen PTS system EIIA component
MHVVMAITELARILNTAPGTIERWIRQGRMPVRKKGDLCEFSRSALEKWADTNHMRLTMDLPGGKPPVESPLDSLRDAMERGGVIYDVQGHNVSEVLGSAVSRMDCIEGVESKNRVLQSLMDREEIMSTGIGKGVAVPHPRAPLTDIGVPALISPCFLEAPIDFNALDRQPVFILFVLMAPSAKHHLHLLARLSFCLRNDDFIAFLRQEPDRDRFLKFIEEFEERELSGK